MLNTLIILHVVICVLLTVVVLLQFGKGAETGAVMGGGGSSQAIFTSSSKGNFFTKMTTFLAVAFMVNSVILTTMKSKESKDSLFADEAPLAAPLNSDALNNAPAANTNEAQKEATPAAPAAKEKPQAVKKEETKAADPAQTKETKPE